SVECLGRMIDIDVREQSELARKGACLTKCDERAACIDELPKLLQPIESHATAYVGRGAIVTQVFELLRLGIRQWLAVHRNVVNDAFGATPLAGNDDDVVTAVQVSLLDVILEDQCVGRLILIEGVAYPTDVLCRTPRAIHSDLRQCNL